MATVVGLKFHGQIGKLKLDQAPVSAKRLLILKFSPKPCFLLGNGVLTLIFLNQTL